MLAIMGRFEGFGYLRTAIRRGRKATLLVAVDWESMLPLPLEEVRRKLSIADPEPYQRLQDDEVYLMRKQSLVHRWLLGSKGRPSA
jgi:hypothetical protein